MASQKPKRVAVVGGGIMGAMTAAHLIDQGATVTLYDPHLLGQGPGASVDTGRSFRVHYGEDQALIQMAAKSRKLWLHWERELGRPLLHTTGKLLIEEPGDRHARDSWMALRRMGLRADRMSQGAVSEEWPGIKTGAATVDRLGGGARPLGDSSRHAGLVDFKRGRFSRRSLRCDKPERTMLTGPIGI